MTREETLLRSAYKRISHGTDFLDAMYDAAEGLTITSTVKLTRKKKVAIKEEVLSCSFGILCEALKSILDKRDRITLEEYMDSKHCSEKLLFDSVWRRFE